MWKKINEKIVFVCKWFKIREDAVKRPTGENGSYFVMETKPSVFTIAMEKAFPENFIYLIKQFRYPTQKWSWEIPAGSTDGEEPLKAAKRELLEETGLSGEGWKYLGNYQVAPGLSDNIGHIYLVTKLTQTDYNEQKEEGIVDCKKFTISEIKYMIDNGDISDGPSLAVLTISNVLNAK